MSFLLDTDTCSAHLKRPSGLMHRFVQHSGGLFIPTIVLGERTTRQTFRMYPTCDWTTGSRHEALDVHFHKVSAAPEARRSR
jgi:hypothetical protein